MCVNQYIEAYLAQYQNYQTYWNYEDGCVLMGAQQLYEATADKKFLQFILRYLDPLIAADGTIVNYETGKMNIDGFNCGKVLFIAYAQTGEDRYCKAIAFLIEQLMKQPRTNEDSFWHKGIYPNQVWLDGLYMAQPFYAAYETTFHGQENYQDIVQQFTTVRKKMYDADKKLYYHGYDAAKVQAWASPETGLSKNFWLRSMGWYLMALVDTIDAFSEQIYEARRALIDILQEAVHGILPYQDKDTKLFYQVIDHPEMEGNYTETSGSAMVAYTLMKGARIGCLPFETYAPKGIEIFDALAAQKLQNGQLTDICKVAGLGPATSPHRDGTIAYYLSEPKTCDDAKGVGPFMMAYAQKLMTTATANEFYD